jgi:iron complex outermembrane receptor protein
MQRAVLSLLYTTMLAGLALSAPAFAADADETANEAQRSDKADIVVNGLREDEGQNQSADGGALGRKLLIDTPYSVTVVDAEDISKRQATTIGQIFVNDPGVFSFATAGTTNWWGLQIRGLGVRNYYVDDVPLLLYWGGDYALESVESVQALKGLTGFMYGFGAPGGTIAYKTKRPTAEPLLTTEIGYRTNSVFWGHVDAGGPLTSDGSLGYRVNLAAEQGTAYNQSKPNRWLGSLALEYRFSPDVKWYATATYEDSKLEREPFQIYWADWAYQDAVLPKPTYNYKNLNIEGSYYKARTLTTATGLDWTFAQGWDAKLTYGYTSKLHHSNKMFVYMLNKEGDYEGNVYNFAELDQSHFAQAMIEGDFTTGPIRHEIVAGASLQINDSFFGSGYYWSNDFNGNIYQDQPFRNERDLDWSTAGGPFRDRQKALFLSDTLHFGEHVQAVLGVRYTKYKLIDDDGDPTVDSGYRTSRVTPTLALIVKPTPYMSLYGSYVESLEPGSRVGGDYANAGEILKPAVSKQYELGIKYQHQGLELTAAAFKVERVNQMDHYMDELRYLTQDGLTVYKGIEASMSYRVNENLRFGLGAIHLDPKIRDVSEDNADLIGHVPAEAAKWQVVGNTEVAIPGVPGLTLHGNVRYFGKAPTEDSNTLYIPDRTLANAGFQYETLVSGRKVTFTGNVNNLFNKKYWGLGNIGEGINASLSAKVSW